MARRPNREEMLTPDDLKELARNLALLSESAVRELYQSAYRDCRIVNSHQLPSPRTVQQLVQAWKQLRKWRR